MSGVNAVEVITEALGRHYAVSFGVCLCGWRTTLTKIGESWRPEFDAHQASVIAALPNIAILPLPEQDAPNTWSALPGFRNPVELTPLDSYPIRHSGDVITNVEGARYLAARLLAAARAGGES